jgi:hypothetical protein
MTIKKTTVLMAAVLAVATVLAAGLTVLPSSVQEAQANPCSVEANNANDADLDCEFEGIGSLEIEEEE